MRKGVAAFILLLALFNGGGGQTIKDCRFVHGCNTAEFGGACYVNIDYSRCSDDELTTKKHWCYNSACKKNCECECRAQGYVLSWCICPGDIIVTQTYQCQMC